MNDHDEAVSLHRYALIAEAVSNRVSSAERGALVRDLARLAHPHPDGGTRVYSRGTLDRWIRAYRANGLAGLRSVTRSDAGGVRRNPSLIDEACALRAELPARSAAQIVSRRHGRSGVTRRHGRTSAGSPMCWSALSSLIPVLAAAAGPGCS